MNDYKPASPIGVHIMLRGCCLAKDRDERRHYHGRAYLRGKRAVVSSKNRWSPPLMDITSALPVSWEGLEYLIEESD
ncbi:hypothetical protein EVAR_22241_1 [Eumeta japonica]|uniref:Uncharacterized protein n=1 Tax=Eumeta variegata TaxID=151549 RepID=A0A4C1UAC0_EUMVA|nr:hypothetical protein EVAR_22241_1 [Eumeta japonica]